MSRDSDPRPWFRPKQVGFGFTPQTWQGFAVVFVPILIVIAVLAAGLR